MNRLLRTGLAAGAAAALPIGLVGVANAATDPASPPEYERTIVDDALTGAAFVVDGQIRGNADPELVVTAFGAFGAPPGPGAPPSPPRYGTVTLYQNDSDNSQGDNDNQGGEIDTWKSLEIISLDDQISWPNKPTLSDVDGDGDNDVIQPGGNFFSSFISQSQPGFVPPFPGGSITWWENKSGGKKWVRHNVLDTTPAASGTGERVFVYHGIEHVDFDGDGKKDLVTVAEDGGNPSDPNDDLTQLQYLPGLGDGEFDAPVNLGSGGGSLPVVDDVNGDGKLDVVSAQFFGAVQGQPFVPPFAQSPASASYVWFDRTGTAADGLDASDFTARIIGHAQGPGFSIQKVENFRGDGVDRWVATNHTNDKLPFPPFNAMPKPNVYEFTPGADVTQPWDVVQLTQDGDISITGTTSNPGQAAPGVTDAADLDGDGDIDLAVSGDGDRRVFWLEQRGDGSFSLHQLPDSAGWGQAGAAVSDLNRDGKAEMIFASFDQNSVGIWQR